MNGNDFDEVTQAARQVAQLLRTVFVELTDEDLRLDTALKRAPLVTVGLAAGAGMVLGLWVGRRSAPPALPPPAAEPAAPAFGGLDNLLPEGLRSLREVLPTDLTEEAGALARVWAESVLEPRLREGLDAVVENVGNSRFGGFLREALSGFEHSEEHTIEDPPEETPPPGSEAL